jgi:hypothetical protein
MSFDLIHSIKIQLFSNFYNTKNKRLIGLSLCRSPFILFCENFTPNLPYVLPTKFQLHIIFNSNTTGAICGAGTANPSRVHPRFSVGFMFRFLCNDVVIRVCPFIRFSFAFVCLKNKRPLYFKKTWCEWNQIYVQSNMSCGTFQGNIGRVASYSFNLICNISV